MKNNNTGTKQLKCMNSHVESSKWWKYAPIGGCDEIVQVDIKTEKVLCWRCTLRSTSGVK
jgi:hypothetical protein